MNVIRTEKSAKTSSFPLTTVSVENTARKSGGENRPRDEKQDGDSSGGVSTGFDIFNMIIRGRSM
jgi:hypothetical protein